MEVYGLIFAILYALGISSVLAVIALLIRQFRRFVLSVGITPVAAVFLFFTTRWLALDYTPGCEAKVPDFRHCPSTLANVVGWIAWVIGVIAVVVAAYWAQLISSSSNCTLARLETDASIQVMTVPGAPVSFCSHLRPG